MPSEDTLAGILLGTAIGDALGLPHEGLRPERIAQRLERRGLRHQLLPGRGMLSDDTEHASMVARALAESRGEVPAFTRAFARQLRRWVVALPPGVGLATLRGALRSCVGIPPSRSGVRSAGNGPAMRSALIGACARDDGHLVDLVRASTRITHTDARAEDAAVLVARMARQASRGEHDRDIVHAIRDDAFRNAIAHAWSFEGDLEAFRGEAGFERGVSGFVVHTLPAVIYCARAASPAHALESAIRLGGDTDTVAAIVGALAGARHGASKLPRAWMDGVRDWPLSMVTLRGLASALAHGEAPPRQRWLAALPRNLAFISLLFAHLGLRAFEGSRDLCSRGRRLRSGARTR
jgi:ADP-ribosylglycohydrolase